MVKSRILVVDDEQGMLEVCVDCLSELTDVEIIAEIKSTRAAERLATESWDLLITDVRMPQVGGVELLRIAHEEDPDLAVLMITAYPNVETAVQCMKLGATDYITKPFLPDDLLSTVRRLLEARQLRQENSLLLRHVERSYSSRTLIGESAAMQVLLNSIQMLAPTDTDVLILGETGTGKELVARALHQQSNRHNKRFVPVDCGAIPEELMESEFFGHERGAFTGADSRSLGLMEFADGGTFFLDEVGELSPRLQVKLLRALEERRVRRVGGREEIDVDIRLIAATARDLDEDIRTKHFRADLYYRINVARIEVPPLRDRASDIPILTHHFVERYAGEMVREDIEITPEVIEILSSYHWPGNVRELQNVIRRTLAMTHNRVITAADLPDEIVSTAALQSSKGGSGFFGHREQRIAAFEKEYLNSLLLSHKGDVPAAATDAELPRGTLYRLLKKHGLNAANFR
ncbi:MAG: sigma-54-dependent Fis family transcriptional regulator [Proteobacteria bacterium]|nr:sigma-54-dependent Fis family transcriptional regulator [Pseudomonadota bacterium]